MKLSFLAPWLDRKTGATYRAEFGKIASLKGQGKRSGTVLKIAVVLFVLFFLGVFVSK